MSLKRNSTKTSFHKSPEKPKAKANGSPNRYTMLMLHVEENNLKEITRLFNRNEVKNINAQNKTGQTALALATRNGNLPITEYLVSKGADLNTRNQSGQTPLFIACWFGFHSIAELFIRTGADVNSADDRGWSPLMIACYHGHKEIVQLLIQSSAEIAAVDCFGKRAIHRCKDPEIFQILEELENTLNMTYYETYSDERSSMISPYRFAHKCSSSRGRTIENLSEREHSKERTRSFEEKDEIQLQKSSPNFSPLRTVHQFIHDPELYEMYLRAGHFSAKKPRTLSKESKRKNGSQEKWESPAFSQNTFDFTDRDLSANSFPDSRFRSSFKPMSSQEDWSGGLKQLSKGLKFEKNSRENTLDSKRSEGFKRSGTPGLKEARKPAFDLSSALKVNKAEIEAFIRNKHGIGQKKRDQSLNFRTDQTSSSRKASKDSYQEKEKKSGIPKEENIQNEEDQDSEIKETLAKYIKDYSNRMEKIVNKKVSYALSFDWKRNAHRIRQNLFHLLMKRAQEFTAGLLEKLENNFHALLETSGNQQSSEDFKVRMRNFMKGLEVIWEMDDIEDKITKDEEHLKSILMESSHIDELLLIDIEENCEQEIAKTSSLVNKEILTYLKNELQTNLHTIFTSLNSTIDRELIKNETFISRLLKETVQDIFSNLEKKLEGISKEQMERIETDLNDESINIVPTDSSLQNLQRVKVEEAKETEKIQNMPEENCILLIQESNRLSISKSENIIAGETNLKYEPKLSVRSLEEMDQKMSLKISPKTNVSLRFQKVETLVYHPPHLKNLQTPQFLSDIHKSDQLISGEKQEGERVHKNMQEDFTRVSLNGPEENMYEEGKERFPRRVEGENITLTIEKKQQGEGQKRSRFVREDDEHVETHEVLLVNPQAYEKSFASEERIEFQKDQETSTQNNTISKIENLYEKFGGSLQLRENFGKQKKNSFESLNKTESSTFINEEDSKDLELTMNRLKEQQGGAGGIPVHRILSSPGLKEEKVDESFRNSEGEKSKPYKITVKSAEEANFEVDKNDSEHFKQDSSDEVIIKNFETNETSSLKALVQSLKPEKGENDNEENLYNQNEIEEELRIDEETKKKTFQIYVKPIEKTRQLEMKAAETESVKIEDQLQNEENIKSSFPTPSSSVKSKEEDGISRDGEKGTKIEEKEREGNQLLNSFESKSNIAKEKDGLLRQEGIASSNEPSQINSFKIVIQKAESDKTQTVSNVRLKGKEKQQSYEQIHFENLEEPTRIANFEAEDRNLEKQALPEMKVEESNEPPENLKEKANDCMGSSCQQETLFSQDKIPEFNREVEKPSLKKSSLSPKSFEETNVKRNGDLKNEEEISQRDEKNDQKDLFNPIESDEEGKTRENNSQSQSQIPDADADADSDVDVEKNPVKSENEESHPEKIQSKTIELDMTEESNEKLDKRSFGIVIQQAEQVSPKETHIENNEILKVQMQISVRSKEEEDEEADRKAGNENPLDNQTNREEIGEPQIQDLQRNSNKEKENETFEVVFKGEKDSLGEKRNNQENQSDPEEITVFDGEVERTEEQMRERMITCDQSENQENKIESKLSLKTTRIIGGVLPVNQSKEEFQVAENINLQKKEMYIREEDQKEEEKAIQQFDSNKEEEEEDENSSQQNRQNETIALDQKSLALNQDLGDQENDQKAEIIFRIYQEDNKRDEHDSSKMVIVEQEEIENELPGSKTREETQETQTKERESAITIPVETHNALKGEQESKKEDEKGKEEEEKEKEKEKKEEEEDEDEDEEKGDRRPFTKTFGQEKEGLKPDVREEVLEIDSRKEIRQENLEIIENPQEIKLSVELDEEKGKSKNGFDLQQETGKSCSNEEIAVETKEKTTSDEEKNNHQTRFEEQVTSEAAMQNKSKIHEKLENLSEYHLIEMKEEAPQDKNQKLQGDFSEVQRVEKIKEIRKQIEHGVEEDSREPQSNQEQIEKHQDNQEEDKLKAQNHNSNQENHQQKDRNLKDPQFTQEDKRSDDSKTQNFESLNTLEQIPNQIETFGDLEKNHSYERNVQGHVRNQKSPSPQVSMNEIEKVGEEAVEQEKNEKGLSDKSQSSSCECPNNFQNKTINKIVIINSDSSAPIQRQSDEVSESDKGEKNVLQMSKLRNKNEEQNEIVFVRNIEETNTIQNKKSALQEELHQENQQQLLEIRYDQKRDLEIEETKKEAIMEQAKKKQNFLRISPNEFGEENPEKPEGLITPNFLNSRKQTDNSTLNEDLKDVLKPQVLNSSIDTCDEKRGLENLSLLNSPFHLRKDTDDKISQKNLSENIDQNMQSERGGRSFVRFLPFENIDSYTRNISHHIPIPSPSRSIKFIKNQEIEEIPLSDSFHHLGQPARHRSLSYEFESGLSDINKRSRTNSAQFVKRERSNIFNQL